MKPTVDVHVHFFSRSFFDSLARASPEPGTAEERLARLGERTGLCIPEPDPLLHLHRWLAELDRHGVEHAVVFASSEDEAADVARAARASGGRLTAFAVVDPRTPGAAHRVRTLMDEQGVRGVLLFPALHRVRVDGPETRAVLAVVDERAGFAVVHCGPLRIPLRDALGIPTPTDASLALPRFVDAAANAFPSVRFVLPHFGGGHLREALDAAAARPHVFLDTSSSNAWAETHDPPLTLEAVWEETLRAVGPDKVLFGTDSSVFPRGWRADVARAHAGALERIGASSATRRAVFGETARRWLGSPGRQRVAGEPL